MNSARRAAPSALRSFSRHSALYLSVAGLSLAGLTGCGDGSDTLVSGPGTDTGAVEGTGGGTSPEGAGGQTAVPPTTGKPTTDPAVVPERDGFELVFHDDFDSLDASLWETASHTFTENASQFSQSQVQVADGQLVLTLDRAAAPSGEGKNYVSGELRTTAFYSYGRFETRAKFTKGSGLVSSLFTYYDHWADATKEENWNEIDVEFLGKDSDTVQFNVIYWDAQSNRKTNEHHSMLTFDPSEDFHVYAIEWLPTAINFYVDENLVHTQTDDVAEFVTLDQRLMMNLWAVEQTPDLIGWAGTFDESILPVSAYYDWVRYYRVAP